MANRQDSILTESQREYLKHGQGDLADSSLRKKRHRIRKRVRAAMADLALLAATAPERDLDTVFGDFEEWNEFQRALNEQMDSPGSPNMAVEPEGAEDGREMTRNIHGAMTFLYLVVAEYAGGVVTEYAGGLDAFESVTATAIELAETTEEERAEVDIEIELTHTPRPTRVIEKYESGESLTEEEFQTLVEAGELDPVELLRREGVIRGE